MNFKGIYYSLTFRLALAIGLTAALTYLALAEEWGWFLFLGIGWLAALRGISLLFKRNAQKVAFMFDAIDNSDYAFKYATRGRSSNDKLVSDSLNRITQILFQAKAEAIQKEKYYELIMNQVNTGIIVEDDKGNIFQTNNEALRLLGLTVYPCPPARTYRRESRAPHQRRSSRRETSDLLYQRAGYGTSLGPCLRDDAPRETRPHHRDQ